MYESIAAWILAIGGMVLLITGSFIAGLLAWALVLLLSINAHIRRIANGP